MGHYGKWIPPFRDALDVFCKQAAVSAAVKQPFSRSFQERLASSIRSSTIFRFSSREKYVHTASGTRGRISCQRPSFSSCRTAVALTGTSPLAIRGIKAIVSHAIVDGNIDAAHEVEKKLSVYLMSTHDFREAVSAFLRAQRPEVRTAFLRRYWYADSVEAVALRLGWSVSKTKSALFRTRKKLKDYLVKEELWHE